MISRHNGELVAECNYCGTEFNGGTLDWDEFIADLKNNEWIFRKEGNEWEHFCPECTGAV